MFDSVSAAGRHYGIGGADTISTWIRKLGKNHLLAKVVRVETTHERDEMAKLRQRVKRFGAGIGSDAGGESAESVVSEAGLRAAG